MSVVRRDIHGLYVKTGGYIFRPQVCWWAKDMFRIHNARPGLGGGEKVRARHHAGTMFATVDGQTWFDHGTYYAEAADERGIVPELPSEICWAPVGAQLCSQTITNRFTGATLPCPGPVQHGEQVCRLHLLEMRHAEGADPVADLVIQEQP